MIKMIKETKVRNKVYFMYSKSGVVKRFSTGINYTDKNNTEEKRRLLSIQSKLNKIVTDYFIKYKVKPSVDYVIEMYRRNIPDKSNKIIDNYNIFLKTKTENRDLKKQSVSVYNTIKTNLEDYTEKTGKKFITDIDKNFISGFRNYLTDEVKIKFPTIRKRIVRFKSFCKYLNDNNIIEIGKDVLNYKIVVREDEEDEFEFYTFTKSELKQLYNKRFYHREDLNFIKDLMIFESMTSIRIGDLIRLKEKDIKDGIITLKSTKVKSKYIVPLNKTSKEIWERWKGVKSFDVYTTQTIFKKLNELLILSGLFTEEITLNGKTDMKRNFISTHTFRRTFVTTCIKNRVLLNEIMKMTSHKTLKVLQVYIDRFTPRGENYEKRLEL